MGGLLVGLDCSSEMNDLGVTEFGLPRLGPTRLVHRQPRESDELRFGCWCRSAHIQTYVVGVARRLGKSYEIVIAVHRTRSASSTDGRMPAAPSSDNQTVAPRTSRGRGGFEVEEVELRVAKRKVCHHGNGGTRLGKPDVVAQLEKTQDSRSCSLVASRPRTGPRGGRLLPRPRRGMLGSTSRSSCTSRAGAAVSEDRRATLR